MGYFSSRNVLERLKFSKLIVTGEANKLRRLLFTEGT